MWLDMGKPPQANSVTFVAIGSAVAARLSGTTPIAATCQKLNSKERDMAVNGSGMRDTARVLKISRNTVTQELKKIFQGCAR